MSKPNDGQCPACSSGLEDADSPPSPSPLDQLTPAATTLYKMAWQARVRKEKRKLDGKRQRLSVFIAAGKVWDSVELEEQDRLRHQLEVMELYSDILGERIAAWPATVVPATVVPATYDPTVRYRIHGGTEVRVSYPTSGSSSPKKRAKAKAKANPPTKPKRARKSAWKAA